MTTNVALLKRGKTGWEIPNVTQEVDPRDPVPLVPLDRWVVVEPYPSEKD